MSPLSSSHRTGRSSNGTWWAAGVLRLIRSTEGTLFKRFIVMELGEEWSRARALRGEEDTGPARYARNDGVPIGVASVRVVGADRTKHRAPARTRAMMVAISMAKA
jgi:hypothetical protein